MATFTDTVLVSSVESAAVDSTIVGAQVGITLAPDIRALSSSETQETLLTSEITVQITYTDTGPILGTYFQLFKCEPVYFGMDKTTEAVNPPKCIFHG